MTETLGGLLDDATRDMLKTRIPAGLIGEPADVASAGRTSRRPGVLFVTGQSLIIDGGQTLPEMPVRGSSEVTEPVLRFDASLGQRTRSGDWPSSSPSGRTRSSATNSTRPTGPRRPT